MNCRNRIVVVSTRFSPTHSCTHPGVRVKECSAWMRSEHTAGMQKEHKRTVQTLVRIAEMQYNMVRNNSVEDSREL